MPLFMKKATSQLEFPDREMTDSEATWIVHQLSEQAYNGKPLRSMYWPESTFPKGGFVAIIEAFARDYVKRFPDVDDLEHLDHIKQGLTLFACVAPDWIVSLVDKCMKNSEPIGQGSKHAYNFGLELALVISTKQIACGQGLLQLRISELRNPTSKICR